VKIAVKRAEALGIAMLNGQIVLIGDTPRDVSAGQETGVRTVAVATGHYSEDELARAGADGVLGSLNPIEPFLSLLEKMGIDT
jgi:phosphoglycolate phosphatase-like HAD superfamily hydrolase